MAHAEPSPLGRFAMTLVRHDDDVDSGYLAVLGHQLLASVAVVQGSMETLHRDGGAISAPNRLLLEDAIERHLARMASAARSLIHDDPPAN